MAQTQLKRKEDASEDVSVDAKHVKKDFWDVLYGFLKAHPWKITLFIVGVTVFSAHYAKKLKLEMDLKRLLPDSYHSVQTLNKIVDKLGGFGDFIFIIESSNWTKTVEFAHDLTKALEARKDMKYVDLERPIEFFEKYRLLYLSADELRNLREKVELRIKKAKRSANPLVANLMEEDEEEFDNKAIAESDKEIRDLEEKYSEYNLRRYFQDPDDKYLVVKAIPAVSQINIKDSKVLYDEMKSLWKDVKAKGQYPDDLKVSFSGAFKSRIYEYDTIVRDAGLSGWVTFILVTALIYAYFRNPIWVAVNLMCFPMSLVWTFAIVYGVYGSLNLVTVFLIMVLFGLGIDYGQHMIARYLQIRQHGGNIDEAITGMLRHAGRSSSTAAIATALAFLVLMFTDFKGFSEFGFITGIGVPLSLLATLVMLPIILIFTERYLGRWLKYKIPHTSQEHLKGKPFPHAAKIFTASLFLLFLGGATIPLLEFEYDFRRLRATPPDGEETHQKLKPIYKGSNSPAVILTDTAEEARRVTAAVREYQEKDTKTPTIDKVRSVLDIVPEDQERKLRMIKKLDDLVTSSVINQTTNPDDKRRLTELKKSLAVRTPVTLSDIPEQILREFRDGKGNISYFTFIYPSVPLADGKNAILFAEDVAEVHVDEKLYYSSSQSVIFAEILNLMIGDGRLAITLTMFIVFFTVWLDFRNWKQAAVAFLPMLVGIFSLLVFLKITGMKLNIFNMVAIPSLIGMGIDFCVHVTHRYFEDPKSGAYYSTAMSGPPVIYAALTTVVGYIGLMFADHPGLNSLGWVSVVGLLLVLVAAVVTLPSFLEFYGQRLAKRQAAQSTSSNGNGQPQGREGESTKDDATSKRYSTITTNNLE